MLCGLAAPLLAGAAAHAVPALARPAVAAGVLRRVGGAGRSGGVALTFDDGPDPDGTPAVLAALQALGWRATFFLLGSQVDAHPALARRVHEEGHELAVHGWSHRNHLGLTPRAAGADLAAACASIHAAVPGARLRWYRPPFGVLTTGSLRAGHRLGLRPVLWSAWGRDWLPGDGPGVARTVLAGLRDGGTVLLHDSDCTSTAGSWRATAAALPLLAGPLRTRGLQVRPLVEHLVPSP